MPLITPTDSNFVEIMESDKPKHEFNSMWIWNPLLMITTHAVFAVLDIHNRKYGGRDAA